jgi:mono/diheme cytochrome c family protein
MRRLVKRILVGLCALLLVAAVAFATAVWLLSGRTFDAPLPELYASTDPAVIERGRYLVRGPAHCTGCHGEDLAGGRDFKIPIGIFRTPNLTPDLVTGIGARSDGEIARALRHGVGHDGRALLAIMPFAHLSDEDLVAVISYLRSLPAVSRKVLKNAPNVLGRIVRAFVLEPVGPTREIPARAPAGVGVERGAYLAESVANCVGCHTERDMGTGAFVGERFAGGFKMGPYVTRNLTPDPKTGWIRSWSEDDFVARFRAGVGPKGSPMPWAQLALMTDEDLRSIYRFLQTVKPVEKDTGSPAKVASRR